MTGCPGEVLRESSGRHCQDWDGGFFLSLKPRIGLAASYPPMSTSFLRNVIIYISCKKIPYVID